MINKNELRIGNLINWNPRLHNPASTLDEMYIEITAVLQAKIGYTFPNLDHRVEPFEDDLLQTEGRYKNIDELEPIRLTRDILQKCSFNETAENFKKEHLQVDETAEHHAFFYSNQHIKLPLAYLHQLQNIYFMLNGEELDIVL